jgi:hypothetical protein
MSNDYEQFSEEEFTEQSLERMSVLAKKFAKAKGESKALEQQRKALKAIIMKEAEERGIGSAQKQERDAYADPRFSLIAEAIGVAARIEAQSKLEYDIMNIRFEKWRTERADYRSAMNMR